MQQIDSIMPIESSVLELGRKKQKQGVEQPDGWWFSDGDPEAVGRMWEGGRGREE